MDRALKGFSRPEVKIPLTRSRAGYLLVNLTQDWLTLSRPLQPDTEEGAYTVRSLSFGKATGETEVHIMSNNMHMSEITTTASAVVTCASHVGNVWMMNGNENEDGDEHQELDDAPDESVFLMDPDHHHHPLPSATQEMRDMILLHLSSPTRTSPVTASCHAAQAGDDRAEEQGQGEVHCSGHGEVRLEQIHGSRPSGPHAGRQVHHVSGSTARQRGDVVQRVGPTAMHAGRTAKLVACV